MSVSLPQLELECLKHSSLFRSSNDSPHDHLALRRTGSRGSPPRLECFKHASLPETFKCSSGHQSRVGPAAPKIPCRSGISMCSAQLTPLPPRDFGSWSEMNPSSNGCSTMPSTPLRSPNAEADNARTEFIFSACQFSAFAPNCHLLLRLQKSPPHRRHRLATNAACASPAAAGAVRRKRGTSSRFAESGCVESSVDCCQKRHSFRYHAFLTNSP